MEGATSSIDSPGAAGASGASGATATVDAPPSETVLPSAATPARRLQTAVRYLTPGPLSRLYYRRRFGVRISRHAEVALSPHLRFGRDCDVAAFTTIKATGPFEAGDRVRIGPGCLIGAGGPGLRLGDDVEIGAGCCIVTGTYTFARLEVPLRDQPYVERRTEIGRGVRIGANVVVLGGSRIGDGAVVLEGSVVSGDVPAGSTVRGNPARVVEPAT